MSTFEHKKKVYGLIERMRLLCDELEQELKEAQIARNINGNDTRSPVVQDQREGKLSA